MDLTQARSHQNETFQNYLNENHVKHWVYANHVDCYIAEAHGHYCGYVRFPKPLLQEQTYNGIVTYVPVHGGITLATSNPDGSVTYGFDCAHAGDEQDPNLWDIDWLSHEVEKMAQCLALAADGYEQAYLAAQDNRSRADVVDAYHKRLEELEIANFELTDNFGAMMNILFGGQV